MSDDVEVEWFKDLESAKNADDTRIGRPLRIGEMSSEGTRMVPCMDCGEKVELSGFAYEFAKRASEALAARGEQPLGYDELTRCKRCGDNWQAKKLAESYRLAERVTGLIREVKSGRDVDEEIRSWLRRHGYSPTAEGLEAITERRREGEGAGKSNSKKSRGEQ